MDCSCGDPQVTDAEQADRCAEYLAWLWHDPYVEADAESMRRIDAHYADAHGRHFGH